MSGTVFRVIVISEQDIFSAHIMPIFCGDKYLICISAVGYIIVIAGMFYIARVKQIQFVILYKTAARVCAAFVGFRIGKKHSTRKLPMQQVGTLKMSPAFIAFAVRTVGAVLKINVIHTVKKAKTVRIVEPAPKRL